MPGQNACLPGKKNEHTEWGISEEEAVKSENDTHNKKIFARYIIMKSTFPQCLFP